MPVTSKEAKAYRKMIETELEGAIITGSVHDPNSDDYGLRVRRGTKEFAVWLQSDGEGNDPAAIKIEEIK